MSCNRLFVIIALLAVLVLLSSCSGGSKAPILPSQPPGTQSNLPIIGLSDADTFSSATGLFGAYEVTLNVDSLTAEIVPKRNMAIGESYVVSGLNFFEMTPCADCIKLIGVDWSLFADFIILTFQIEHPFPRGTTSQPPSAFNRRDLDVFDLAAVIHPRGITATNFPGMNQKVYGLPFRGAEGFTTDLSGTVISRETAALPYFLVVDDSLDEDPPVSTYNKFPMGGEETFRIWIDPYYGPTPPFRFDMYLTMGYGFSATKAQRLSPKYYNPEFNRKAAWKAIALPPHWALGSPSIANTWNNTDSTTEWNVRLEVYDWQVGATVSSSSDFADAPSNRIFAKSDVREIQVEVLGMTNQPVIVTNPTPVSGSGKPNDPLIYEIPIANENLLEPGYYPALAKVTDSRAPGNWNVDDRDFLIDTPDGIQLDNYNLSEFATYYYMRYAAVVSGCGPITGSITSPSCPINNASDGEYINFIVSASSANDGNPILLYEVDYDWNGITFTTDFSNTNGIFNNVGPFDNPNCGGSNDPITYWVAFRASDSCDPQNVTVFDTCYVTVTECCTPGELFYDFAGCTTIRYACQGWSSYNGVTGVGGCGYYNTDDRHWGEFKWGCNVGTPSGCSCFSFPYIVSGPDFYNCDYRDDHDYDAEFNVASPSINLPSSTWAEIEFDHFNNLASGAAFRLYISLNDCAGPWTQIWNSTIPDGCFENTTVNISSYTGSNVRFMFSYQSVNYMWDPGSINAGVMIDNIRISGCFDGVLSD